MTRRRTERPADWPELLVAAGRLRAKGEEAIADRVMRVAFGEDAAVVFGQLAKRGRPATGVATAARAWAYLVALKAGASGGTALAKANAAFPQHPAVTEATLRKFIRTQRSKFNYDDDLRNVIANYQRSPK